VAEAATGVRVLVGAGVRVAVGRDGALVAVGRGVGVRVGVRVGVFAGTAVAVGGAVVATWMVATAWTPPATARRVCSPALAVRGALTFTRKDPSERVKVPGMPDVDPSQLRLT
jgi:hypothetical protein